MSPKEINRATIAAFLIRCIGHGWANAIDAEHGLRIANVVIDERGDVRIELDDGSAAFLAITHLVPRRVSATRNGKETHARDGSH